MSREPTHPGEILLEEFLIPHGRSIDDLASLLGLPKNCVTNIVQGRAALTVSDAQKLAGMFCTTVEFWTNLQTEYDNYHSGWSEVNPLLCANCSGLAAWMHRTRGFRCHYCRTKDEVLVRGSLAQR